MLGSIHRQKETQGSEKERGCCGGETPSNAVVCVRGCLLALHADSDISSDLTFCLHVSIFHIEIFKTWGHLFF